MRIFTRETSVGHDFYQGATLLAIGARSPEGYTLYEASGDESKHGTGMLAYQYLANKLVNSRYNAQTL